MPADESSISAGQDWGPEAEAAMPKRFSTCKGRWKECALTGFDLELDAGQKGRLPRLERLL
jgi:hypothetical protein